MAFLWGGVSCTTDESTPDENNSKGLSDAAMMDGIVRRDTGPSSDAADAAVDVRGTGDDAANCDRVVEGRRYDPDIKCLGPLEQVGCVDSRLGCTELPVPATATDGSCWQLPHTCLPAGFVPSAASGDCSVHAYEPTCDSEILKSARTPCDADERTITAVSYNAVGRCSTTRHVIGCYPDGWGCVEWRMTGVARDGSCWVSEDGCPLSGFNWADSSTDCSSGPKCGDFTASGLIIGENGSIAGRRYDSERGCLGPLEPLEYVDETLWPTCGKRPQAARRADLSCWLIYGKCLPSQFATAASADTCSTITDKPLCK